MSRTQSTNLRSQTPTKLSQNRQFKRRESGDESSTTYSPSDQSSSRHQSRPITPRSVSQSKNENQKQLQSKQTISSAKVRNTTTRPTRKTSHSYVRELNACKDDNNLPLDDDTHNAQSSTVNNCYSATTSTSDKDNTELQRCRPSISILDSNSPRSRTSSISTRSASSSVATPSVGSRSNTFCKDSNDSKDDDDNKNSITS